MHSYYPITICRSDGMLAVQGRDGTMEPNQPTQSQLKQDVQKEKDECFRDYYRKVERNSEKDIDWRRKLGGMLMHLAGNQEQLAKSWILDALPEHYILWEHVKYSVDKNGDAKKSETTHAAGGMERQDAYLYGHPQGRKKRYRSPSEFFEHLLWLAANREDDPKPCCCKICAPVASDGDEVSVGESKEPMVPIETPNPAKRVSVTTLSTLAPPPRSREQVRDRDANSAWIYRLGELVWYSKGQAWGLAVIAKRQELNGKPRYLLQPLSNPLRHAKPVIKNQEDELRPWLAWSVPDTTHISINNITFDNVPWENVLRGEYGRGDAEVDGSILASKAIDISYSFFGRVEAIPSVPGETHWNAMFLGAEKIWVGEPVRLRGVNDGSPNSDILVMIIYQMIEKSTSPTPSNAQVSSSIVSLIGDIYTFVTSTDKPIDPPDNLPIRMIADLRFRNEAARAASRQEFHSWSLVQAAARRSIPDIKGRWYESRKLLPVLRTREKFQENLAQGMTSDVGTWMNGRGDSNVINGGKRRKNRRDTLGKSVPENFSISKGLDSTDSKGIPCDDNVFPEDGAVVGEGEQQVLALDVGEEDLDQFMNLADETAAGFYGDSMVH